MRKYNKIISICLVIMFIFTVLPVSVFAEEAHKGSYSIGLSSSSIKKGKSTTLKITTKYCAGKFNVTSSNSSVAKVTTSSTWVDGESYITVTGVSKGSATITVTPVDVADQQYNDITASKSVTIKVTEKAAVKVEEQDNKVEVKEENKEEKKTKSSDATLKNITVKNGDLVFAKDKTEYTVNVGKDVTSLGLKATSNSSKATVKITGDENFVVGENIVKITVTAEDGTTKVYTIKVIKSKYGLGPVLDLKVKDWGISPEFDPAKLEYSVDVTGVTEVELEYTLKDETSKAEVVGNKNLKVGKNEIKLIVTEQDGTVTTYVINVNLVENIAEKSNTIWLVIIVILAVLVIIEAVYIVVKNKNK